MTPVQQRWWVRAFSIERLPSDLIRGATARVKKTRQIQKLEPVSILSKRKKALARLQLAIEFVLGHDPVAAGSLGEIQRAIASLDQIRHRLAELKLSDPDGNRDAGKNLPGRAAGDATLRDCPADALGNHPATCEIGTREHGDEFFPAISSRQIDIPKPLPQHVRHQPKHLVADAVPKIVVERLEMIDVDQQDAERLALFHRSDLGLAKKLIERTAVWQTGERIGLGALFRFVQGVADRVQLSRRLDKARLQFRGTGSGFGQLAHQILDKRFWINLDFALVGDIADGAYLRTVIGDGHRQKLLRGGHHRMQLLGNVVEIRLVGGVRSDIGREQVAIGGGVELSLVADQNIDGPFEIG